MDFIVAASNGTHVYKAKGLEKPTLVRSLPPAQPGNPQCLASCAASGRLAVLLRNGAVGVWDLRGPAFQDCPQSACGSSPSVSGEQRAAACELPPQSAGPITRCYFSPRGSFLVAWEPLSGGAIQRIERPVNGANADSASKGSTPPAAGAGKGNAKAGSAYSGGKGIALTRAENLTVWSIVPRPAAAGQSAGSFDVEVVKDGTRRLGINVDHLDTRSGLLIRRVDPGLIEEHNRQIQGSVPGSLVLPGDVVLAVNAVDSQRGASAQEMAEEIQRATTLRLRLLCGPGWACAFAVAKMFVPHLSPLRWPPLAWSTDELYAFRCVTSEIQVLNGQTLQQLWKLTVDGVSQMSVSPKISQERAGAAAGGAIAAWCPPGANHAAPAMVRVYTNFGKTATPALTKSFFSDASWVTMKWDPVDGTDLLMLVHAAELTEADVEGRTLHGQGGNGLYLLRASEASEPICGLAGAQDGVSLLDVQWCPAARGGLRSLVVLQGPQPALVSVFSYRRGGGDATQRVNLGRFGVRNSIRWDVHGRSFCLRVHSNRGAGVSSEADSIDLFDAPTDGENSIARRAGAAVGGRRDREQAISPAITAVDFSPDGQVLLTAVEAHSGPELKFLSAADATALYRLKFDEVYAARWQPAEENRFEAPHFAVPSPEARLGALAGGTILEVEIRDREMLRRQVKGLQARLKEIERLKSKEAGALDQQQQQKVEAEAEFRSSLMKLEAELEAVEQPDRIVFEVQTVLGVFLLYLHRGESCRDVARRFCKERRLDAQVAGALAERMEQRLQRPVVGGKPGVDKREEQPQPRRHGPKPKVIDLGDKEAVRRRVRALQKKLREIEKLKITPETSLDQLQREKVASESEVRTSYESLAKELDLLDRLPRMVFDVETETGVRFIEFRDGDSCLQLAANFCQEHGLDNDLIEPLAQHMKEKLSNEEIIEPDQ